MTEKPQDKFIIRLYDAWGNVITYISRIARNTLKALSAGTEKSWGRTFAVARALVIKRDQTALINEQLKAEAAYFQAFS